MFWFLLGGLSAAAVPALAVASAGASIVSGINKLDELHAWNVKRTIPEEARDIIDPEADYFPHHLQFDKTVRELLHLDRDAYLVYWTHLEFGEYVFNDMAMRAGRTPEKSKAAMKLLLDIGSRRAKFMSQAQAG